MAKATGSGGDERSNFVVVANRLPVTVGPDGNHKLSPGGLVSAVLPVMRERGGTWIGWDGTDGDDHEIEFDDVRLLALGLSQDEEENYYGGACNETIWPLYHDAIQAVEYHRHTWAYYREVNRRFAEAVAGVAADGGTVWVHDYHLQLMPAMLRDMRPDLRIGFYLHTPFPPLEIFARLPWRTEVLDGLLGADLIGVQTAADARNVLASVNRFSEIDDLTFAGAGGVVRSGRHNSTVKAFPISIDYDHISDLAADDHVVEQAAKLRAELGNPEVVILGVDRLDYTKGIDLRLKAIHELLVDERLDPARTAVVQVAVPSREAVHGYERIRHRVEQLVGTINGDFGTIGRPIVTYIHHSLPFDELLILYRAADVMLVTPFQDGMNLVAKEYVASRTDNGGALVLSEFAGAADELDRAFLVNPYDTEGLKEQIAAAAFMGPDEREARMKAMRERVSSNDIYAWAESFLAVLALA